MWQEPAGAWEARADLEEPVIASGQTRELCLDALFRAVEEALPPASRGDREGSRGLLLLVETIPILAGVAEASEVMGWDKRRVVTYLDRGSFPPPLQTLRSGRVWIRADLERFATTWRARRDARRARSSRAP
jgi:hypothetical protein